MWCAHSRAESVSGSSSAAMGTTLKIADQGIPEGAGRDLRGALHLTREVIGHNLFANRTVHGSDDGIGGFHPAHVAKHHFGRENQRARIYLIEIRVLRRRAVGGFKYRMSGHVIDIATRCDADSADLGCEGV